MMREQANAHLMNEWNELQDIEARVTLLPVMPEKKHLADHVNEQFNELAARGRSTLGTIKKAILRKQYELACIQRHLIENVRCVKAVKSRMMQMVG
jgi:hypothetical protein